MKMTLEEFNGSRGQAIGEVARAYEEITNNLVPRAAIEDIGFYFDKGLEPELMIKAIEATAERGLRWNYTKAILKRCLEEKIFTSRDWDFQVLFKKGISEVKKDCPQILQDDVLLSMYLAATVFKEYINETEKDVERYIEAVKNGDTSEWESRWSKYQII